VSESESREREREKVNREGAILARKSQRGKGGTRREGRRDRFRGHRPLMRARQIGVRETDERGRPGRERDRDLMGIKCVS
jgi:hypothetical protein